MIYVEFLLNVLTNNNQSIQNQMKIEMLFSLISLFIFVQGFQFYNYDPMIINNKIWMSTIPDYIPVKQLSIPGTHSSMANDPIFGSSYQTQSTKLQDQLYGGVRAIDIRCQHQANNFKIYNRQTYLNIYFDGVIAIVESYLTTYPSETFFMHIIQENSPIANTQSFEDTFLYYKSTTSIFWNPARQNPTLGEVRGKIVVIQNFPGATQGLLYTNFNTIQHFDYSTNWDQHARWDSIKQYIIDTAAAKISRIGFWSGSTGSDPYFCASGKNAPANASPQLSTGLTTPTYATSYPDFPRTSCFVGICTIVFKGINILSMEYIMANSIKYSGIVFFDFPGDDAIGQIIRMKASLIGTCTPLQISRGCESCSMLGTCLSCNVAQHYVYNPLTYECDAASGYFLDMSFFPQLCSTTLEGCLTCSSSSVCTACATGLNYQLVVDHCEAADGYYLNGSYGAVPCGIAGCLRCASLLGNVVCTVCDGLSYFEIDFAAGCRCMTNYIFDPTTYQCIYNLPPPSPPSPINDNTIKIQGQQVQWIDGDVCSKKLNTIIKLPSLYPVSQYDKIQIYYPNKINPNQTIENTNLIITNSNQNILQNSIQIKFDIVSDPISDQLYIVLSNSALTTKLPIKIHSFIKNNKAVALYSSNQCENSQKIKHFVLFCLIASLVIMVLGIFSMTFKLIGLQLFGVLQLAYFSIAEHFKNIDLYIYQLTNLKLSRGLNVKIFQQENQFSSKLPNPISEDLNLYGYFVNNLNIMLAIPLLFVSILFIHSTGRFFSENEPGTKSTKSSEDTEQSSNKSNQKQNSKNVWLTNQLFLKFIYQSAITLTFFSCYNFAVSTALFIKYYNWQAAEHSLAAIWSIIGIVVFMLCLLLIFIKFSTNSMTNSYYGQFKDMFKQNFVCKMYMIFSYLFRIIMGVMIIRLIDNIYGSMFLLFVGLSFTIFILIYLPFKHWLHNYRAILVHIAQIVILFAADYYRSMKHNTPLQIKSHMHQVAIIVYVFIGIVVVLSVVVVCFDVIGCIRKMLRKSDPKINPQKEDKKTKPPTTTNSRSNHLFVSVTEDSFVQ